jgi:hypothetical protein
MVRFLSYPSIYLSLALILGASAANPLASQNQDSTTLPKPLATAVLQNLSSLTGLPRSKFKVAKVEPATWQDCLPDDAGVVSLEPCPAVPRSGWRTVVGGPIRWVYYLERNSVLAGNFIPTPDGLQSVPEAVRQAAIANAAKQVGVSLSELRVQWVEPKLFDRCLSVDNQKLNCRQGIQPGWEVLVLGGKPINNSGLRTEARTYHVNLTGNDVRFARQGFWVPPP